MKRILFLATLAVALVSCGSKKPAELYIPKNTVEFAGNAFNAFSLGADVKLYTEQNPDNKSEWLIQSVVPVRKETPAQISGLVITLTPVDDRGIRIRDSFVMHGEDLENLVPVYNSGNGVERSVVFSVRDGQKKKYFSYKEAQELVSKTKGVRMDFVVPENIPQATAAQPASASTPAPNTNTLDGLCRKYGVYGMLSSYDAALRRGDKKGAKNIEDRLWEIEKRVKNDGTISKDLRERFVDYVEDREDEIEDRY